MAPITRVPTPAMVAVCPAVKGVAMPATLKPVTVNASTSTIAVVGEHVAGDGRVLAGVLPTSATATGASLVPVTVIVSVVVAKPTRAVGDGVGEHVLHRLGHVQRLGAGGRGVGVGAVDAQCEAAVGASQRPCPTTPHSGPEGDAGDGEGVAVEVGVACCGVATR